MRSPDATIRSPHPTCSTQEESVRVLAIGAHPDDIELGCGATLAAHRARGDDVTLLVMTTGEQGPQAARSRVHEQQEAARLLGARLEWGGFDDGAVPDGRDAVEIIEGSIQRNGIDAIYTHASSDSHQDHRNTALASLAAARRTRQVLLYESPTTLGFQPDLFVDIDGYVEPKLELLRAHLSQVLKNCLVDLDAIVAQARYRGFTGRVRHAEGFECSRYTVRLGAEDSGCVDLDLAVGVVTGGPR
jgi:LmbE family N-acetylglucosaminyl deacetylase